MGLPPYTYRDLLTAYEALGVQSAKTVLVTGNFGRLMAFERRGKEAVLAAHHDALREVLGPEGTIVVFTASRRLCNTETPFDPAKTSSESGTFSEYIRTRPDALRSFHPFCSYAAIGPLAKYITQDITRHAYGPETPEARLIELDALHVVVGLEPNLSLATNHHLEHLMGVPYRYVREYLHPVVRDGTVRREPFYLLVWYRGAGVKADKNRKLFSRFTQKHRLLVERVGRGKIHSYSMRAFYDEGVRAFKEDIYAWTAAMPDNPVYREWM